MVLQELKRGTRHSQHLGGKGRRISVSLRAAWSTRASSRIGSKATKKFFLKKPKKKFKEMVTNNRYNYSTWQVLFPILRMPQLNEKSKRRLVPIEILIEYPKMEITHSFREC